MASASRLGLVRCEYCNRQFNPHSAARHIPWCSNKHQNETRKPRLTNEKQQALERYKWRISYRPTNYLSRCNHQLPNRGGGGGGRRNGELSNGPLLSSSLSSSSSSYLAGSGGGGGGASGDSMAAQRTAFAHNSSALSSPASSAASTSTSLGGSSARSNHTNHTSHQLRPQQRRDAHTSPPPAVAGRLTRSVSSITLTKRPSASQQRGRTRLTGPQAAAAPPPRLAGGAAQADTQSIASTMSERPSRAKSHSDFTNISEIVDVLARRMDEIYAQNKRLLADLAKSNGLRCNTSRPSSVASSAAANDNDADEDDDEDDDENTCDQRCHHCKAGAVRAANYCHKCGCKLQARSAAAAATINDAAAETASSGRSDSGA